MALSWSCWQIFPAASVIWGLTGAGRSTFKVAHSHAWEMMLTVVRRLQFLTMWASPQDGLSVFMAASFPSVSDQRVYCWSHNTCFDLVLKITLFVIQSQHEGEFTQSKITRYYYVDWLLWNSKLKNINSKKKKKKNVIQMLMHIPSYHATSKSLGI